MTRYPLRFRAIALGFVGFLCTTGQSLPARAQIYQPGSQPIGADGGITALVQSSTTCVRCHADYLPNSDAEPWDSWRGSMMGNAARDPVFRAALSVAEADNPAAADFCVRCHSMPAWLRGRSSLPEWSSTEGARFSADDPAFLSDDLDGVACMTCHRSTDQVAGDPNAPHLLNARLHLLDGPRAEDRLGPYSYTAGEDPQHPAAQSTFLPQGAFCGQCHDIVNPVVNGVRNDGTPTGRPFTIERTFSEWRASVFPGRAQTCQHCHMADVAEDVPAAQGGPNRTYMRRHDLVGGSTWVPRSLANTLDDAGIRPEVINALRATSDKARAFLRTAARVEVRSSQVVNGTLEATVRVTNLTGHKLPTGYPEGRRMWLELTVTDARGNIVAGSGQYDMTNGTLQNDAQQRTYEAKLGQGTTPSFHFVQNNSVLSDTRIPPEGFAPTPELDMEPVGRDYGSIAAGFRNYDDVTYRFSLCSTEPVTVRARLRYQSTTREYIEFLRDNARPSLEPGIGNWGQRAYMAWQQNGGLVPEEMAEVMQTVGPNSGPCTSIDAGLNDAGPTGDVPDSGTEPAVRAPGCSCGVRAAETSTQRLTGVGLAGLALVLTMRRKRQRLTGSVRSTRTST